MTMNYGALRDLMSSRDEADALASRITADGYEVLGLDSMPIAHDVVSRPERDWRRVWEVVIGYNRRGGQYMQQGFASVGEYERWHTARLTERPASAPDAGERA